jgi:hypothetical protein
MATLLQGTVLLTAKSPLPGLSATQQLITSGGRCHCNLAYLLLLPTLLIRRPGWGRRGKLRCAGPVRASGKMLQHVPHLQHMDPLNDKDMTQQAAL